MHFKMPDRHDFERQVTPQLEAAFRFALHLAGQEADAQDLLQDACFQAFTKFHTFKGGSNFKAWFFRIIKNLHIDNYRQKKRGPEVKNLSNYLSLLADGEVETRGAWIERNPPGSIENENLFYDLFGDEVKKFLAELPDEFRTAILLCDVEGMSYQEISDVLECPVGTIRSRLFRARSYLKERLYDYAKSLGYVKEPIS